ncbi:hypothetical protein [Enterococcus mundtii]|uniref:hypothetical protein n=1 Tax=Enterococcus mundtii TaxID=53346 RepID=UPI003970C982
MSKSKVRMVGEMLGSEETKYEFGTEEKIEILEKIKPVIEYALQQTSPQNRDDLRQHLYEIVMKILKNVKFSEPKGLLVYSVYS